MPLKRRGFKLGQTLCAYCGVQVSAEREDPVPLALYPDSVRPKIQFFKIPACHDCNHAKSHVDGSLRDFLTINIESQAHPVAMEVFNEKTVRAVQDNHVRMLDQFYEGNDVWEVSPSGEVREYGYETPYDSKPLIEAVVWLTRGMHWAVHGTSVPAEHTKVWLIPRHQAVEWVQRFHRFLERDWYEQGDPFACGWVATDEGHTLWAHSFYDSVLFMAITKVGGPVTKPEPENAFKRKFD